MVFWMVCVGVKKPGRDYQQFNQAEKGRYRMSSYKNTTILDMLMRINELKDEDLNELRELLEKEYNKRQEERRRVVESIRKGYISSYEDL